MNGYIISLSIAAILLLTLYFVADDCYGGLVSKQPTITKMRVTAYCPCKICCGKWSRKGLTASGHKIKNGDRFVAAPKYIPFGTMVDVHGYGFVSVLDRGGAIHNRGKYPRLDTYFNTHKEALGWGVKYLDVKIYVR